MIGEDRRRSPVTIASYNVENMFRRPKALFDPETKKANQGVLDAYSRLIKLLEQDSYEGDQGEILKQLGMIGLERADENEFAVLRMIRGKLLKRPRDPKKPVEVVAKGRGDWIGWVELKREAVNSEATRNTARVMADVDADVQAVVEAEDRMTLERFNEYVIGQIAEEDDGVRPFSHVMLVDGNDERGIDVGVMTRKGFPIEKVRSHIDDLKEGKRIFSRDCAEYEIPTPDGGSLLLMVNHFKSKRGGGDNRRKEQAERVATIYRARRREGWKRIVVAGDLNDTPGSDSLKPLLAETDLRDAGTHEDFAWGERTGTYGTGNDQFDYLLLSPALYKVVRAGGVNRRGVWHGPRVKNPWEMLPTLAAEDEAASDHAAIWVDLDL